MNLNDEKYLDSFTSTLFTVVIFICIIHAVPYCNQNQRNTFLVAIEKLCEIVLAD